MKAAMELTLHLFTWHSEAAVLCCCRSPTAPQGAADSQRGIGTLDSVMSQRRIFLMAVAIGFIGGFSFVAVANSSTARVETSYSAAG